MNRASAPRLALTALLLFLAASPAPAFAALADEARGYPVVTESWPKADGVDVPVDAKVMVVFSRPMKRADINEFTVTLNDGLSDLATNVRYNAELRKAVVTPLEDLLPKHVYYVTVSRTVRDADDNPMGRDHTFKFRTVDEVVKVPPVISDIAPTVGADEVAPDANVELTFSADIDERTLTEENLRVTADGKRVLGVTRYYPAARRAVFVPDRAFPAGAKVEVSAAGIADIRGVPMESPRAWSFRVAKAAAVAPRPAEPAAVKDKSDRLRRIAERIAGKDAPDAYGSGPSAPGAKTRVTPRPSIEGATVVEQFPAEGARNIRTDAAVRVKFGFDANPDTLSLFNFSLREGDDYVFGRVTYDKVTREAVFTPAGRLKPNHDYTVKLSAKIESTDGRSLGSDVQWTFKTVEPTATFSAVAKEAREREAAPDAEAPHVVTLYPADRAEEVPADVVVRAVFNEPLRDFTVNSFTFRLRDGDADLDGSIGYESATRTATFRPKRPLQAGRSYTALLTKGIMDEAGNYMLRERTWRFTVGGRAPAPDAVAEGPHPDFAPTVTAAPPAVTPREYTRPSTPATSAAASRDARIEMKAIEALNSSPEYGAVKSAAEFEIGPEEMERRLAASDKSAVGRVAPRRISDAENDPDGRDRSKMLNKTLDGTDVAFSDDVKRDLKRFLSEDTRRKKEVLAAVNEVNDLEAATADGMYASEPPVTEPDGGETRRFHAGTKGRSNGLFENELQYKALAEVKRFEQPSVSPKAAARTYPVSNLKHDARHARGSGMINGVSIDDLEDEGGIRAPSVTAGAPADPPSPTPAAPPEPSLRSPVDDLVPAAPAAPEGARRPAAGDDLDAMFTPPADPGAFMVTAIHPRRGAETRPDTIVTASFNRDVDLASVTGQSFLVTAGEEIVDGKIVFNPRINKVIFRPKEPLKPREKYKVTLTSGIRDAAGSPLRPLSWDFETAQM